MVSVLLMVWLGYCTFLQAVAGENHLAMLSADGELLTFGDGTMGQLGRSVRANHIRSSGFFAFLDSKNFLFIHFADVYQSIFSGYMCDEKRLVVNLIDPLTHGKKKAMMSFCDVHASGFWTLAKAEDGRWARFL